jgi:hypothetical protein
MGRSMMYSMSSSTCMAWVCCWPKDAKAG